MVYMVSNKVEMYRMLHRGDFGNTVPMWFDMESWFNAAMGVNSPYNSIYWWGVRSLTPSGPCRLNVSLVDVHEVSRNFIRCGYQINISPMIDRIVTVTMWANICRTNNGLYVEYIEYPSEESNWRARMPTQHKVAERTSAKLLLEKHLNPNTLDDLGILLDKYPDAVVELSATEKHFGTVPGRNAVIWEVRNY